MQLHPKQPAEMEAAHRRGRPAESARPKVAKPRNLRPVLALGDTEFLQFRGRAYGVPPVPLALGHQLTDAYVDAVDAMRALGTDPHNRELIAQWYGALGKLPDLLWRHVTVIGRVRRLRRWCRLLRNEFKVADEQELMQLADFFLRRRMTSRIRSLPPGHPLRQPTSSMIS